MYGTPTVKEIEKATTWSALKAKLAGREDVQRALIEVAEEVLRAERQHPAPYHSPHEGHSVIREEVEELWDHVRANTGRSDSARHEARQVAATSVRYMLNLTKAEVAK